MNAYQKWRINPVIRIELYTAMNQLIANGLDSHSIVKDMAKEFKRIKHPLFPLLETVEKRLRGHLGEDGKVTTTFGMALMGLVPVNEALIIHAGETGGMLADGFLLASDYVNRNNKIYQTLRSELSKPTVYIALVLIVFGYFGMGIFPQLSEMSPRKTWPLFAQNVGSIADASLYIVIAAVTFFAVSGTAVFWLASRWCGKSRDLADKYLFPFTFIRHINAAALLTSLSAFMQARMSFDVAIKNLESNSSPYLRAQYKQLISDNRNAIPEHEAICRLSVVDTKFNWILRIYSKTNSLGQTLQNVSHLTSIHVEEKCKSLARWCVLGSYIAIAATVLGLLSTMFLIASAVGKPAM